MIVESSKSFKRAGLFATYSIQKDEQQTLEQSPVKNTQFKAEIVKKIARAIG